MPKRMAKSAGIVWLLAMVCLWGGWASVQGLKGESSEAIRVACVGDSITYGSSIRYRLRDCYPAQLGRLLGDGWQVRNFGVSGATMLKSGDKPYGKEQAYRDVPAFAPLRLASSLRLPWPKHSIL